MNIKLKLEYAKTIEKINPFLKPNYSINLSKLTYVLGDICSVISILLLIGVVMFIAECPNPKRYLEENSFVEIYGCLMNHDYLYTKGHWLAKCLSIVVIFLGNLAALLDDFFIVDIVTIFLFYNFMKFYKALQPEYKLVKFENLDNVFFWYVVANLAGIVGWVCDWEFFVITSITLFLFSSVIGSIFFVLLRNKWSAISEMKHLANIWCIFFIGNVVFIILYLIASRGDYENLIIIVTIAELILSLVFYQYIMKKSCIVVSGDKTNVNLVEPVGQIQDAESLSNSDNQDEEDFDAIDDEVDEEELTEVEEKYKEEVEFLLEEGAIDAEGRKLLERKRVRWEISEERANELEQMCSSSSDADYTNEENEYIEIYQELSADGEITERKRRMLERERESLGISEERAKELEENC
jgi:hypothetical protein